MNLLFILENYPPHYGGVETVFKNICERLAKKGHKVTLITHHIKGTKRRERVNGVDIIRVPCFYSRYLFTFIAPFFAFKFAKGADIIHTTTFNAAPAAWLVARLSGKPVVLTVHETWLGKWREYTNMSHFKAWFHNLLERIIFLLRYDRYVSVSESTARRVREVIKKSRGRVVVIHNGFDYSHWSRSKYLSELRETRDFFRKSLGGDFFILGYGRPGYSKGFEFLIKAMKLIIRRAPNSRLVLILSNDRHTIKERRKFLKMIDDEGVDFCTLVLDPVGYGRLPAFVGAADCVVVPSITEGFGYTTVESNAMGTPVVASNTTSIPEVISGKYVLVKPKSPLSISRGVFKVMKGDFSSTPLKKFYWSDNIEKLKNLYYSLLSEKRG